jgi:two-component system, NtrC family, sensor kinase
MTERPDNPETLPDPEASLRLIESSPIALITADRDLRVSSINPAAREVLGLNNDDLTGMPLVHTIVPRHRRAVQRLLQRVLRDGLTPKFEVPLPTNTGAERNLSVRLAPMKDAAGEQIEGVAVWFVDQTELRHRADQLAQREKMASLGTLAAGVAHHFNNILGGITTAVDYALTSLDFLAMKRALQTTAEAAARASKIVQSLLSFAEHPHRPDDLADLTEVVLTFVQLVERPLAERHIKLNLDLQKVPITEVQTHRMHQVLGNLLSNAEEAMPNGGNISLSLRAENGCAVLRFSDSGNGIPKRELPMVFEPFYTTKGLHASGDKVNPGLGLSVVHGIIVELGGTISVDSELGEGTTFTIRLPIDEGVADI